MKRGRRIALAAVAAGIAVLAAAALALREPLLEEWWLHRLGSEDRDAQKAAAEGLGRLGSLRAIRPLLAKTRNPHHGYFIVNVEVINALEKIAERRGRSAVPFFIAALGEEANPMARAVGVELLRHLDPGAHPPEPPDGVPLDPFVHDVYFEMERPAPGRPASPRGP